MGITIREAQRITHQENVLLDLGFTQPEATALRRISMTLHRWYERECGIDGGCIERDEATNRPLWRSEYTGRTYPVADRETGALKRLRKIMEQRNSRTGTPISYYVQTDPRGAPLYILRPGDVPEGERADCYYSRGICVY
jgi:hypothetical protein